MRTNIDINDQLLTQAIHLTGAKTKREVVELGLQKLLQTAQRPQLASLLGRGDIDPAYDYKALRARLVEPGN
jgi:Arc/MetJ family transcription regulator